LIKINSRLLSFCKVRRVLRRNEGDRREQHNEENTWLCALGWRNDDRVRCWLFSRRRDRPGNETDVCVYGDSRSMMYLPYKSDQEADARQLMVDMFDLVLPEKVSEEVIKKAKKGTSKTRADHCY
jgi:hypothetical protein